MKLQLQQIKPVVTSRFLSQLDKQRSRDENLERMLEASLAPTSDQFLVHRNLFCNLIELANFLISISFTWRFLPLQRFPSIRIRCLGSFIAWYASYELYIHPEVDIRIRTSDMFNNRSSSLLQTRIPSMSHRYPHPLQLDRLLLFVPQHLQLMGLLARKHLNACESVSLRLSW
jgi:hypothetical protein